MGWLVGWLVEFGLVWFGWFGLVWFRLFVWFVCLVCFVLFWFALFCLPCSIKKGAVRGLRESAEWCGCGT